MNTLEKPKIEGDTIMEQEEFTHREPSQGLSKLIKKTGIWNAIVGSVTGTLVGVLLGGGVVWGAVTQKISAAEKAIDYAVSDRKDIRDQIEKLQTDSKANSVILNRLDSRLETLLEFYKIPLE